MMMDIVFGSPRVYKLWDAAFLCTAFGHYKSAEEALIEHPHNDGPCNVRSSLLISKEGIPPHATLCKFLCSNANTVS